MTLSCVVLAAGRGTRMNSALPKVLHKVCGIPLLQAVLNTAHELNPQQIIVVVGEQGDLIKKSLSCKGAVFVMQRRPRGTGHALQCARPVLKEGNVIVVLNGDSPLLTSATIKRFLGLHRNDKNAISVLSFRADNPEPYGRMVRDSSGRLLSVVEEKEADSAQKEIHEVNSGVYAINQNALDVLDAIKMNRAKNEYYLTDIVTAASDRGIKTAAYCIGTEREFMGVNTREELTRASGLMKRQIIDKWIERGVTFFDPASVFVHPDVSIGKETILYPNVYLEGHTTIGKNSVIYPNVRIQNSDIGKDVEIKDCTVIENSRIKDGASVGPFARIRSDSEVGKEARIGNFVELKKAIIGRGSKVSHLSYIGDALVGNDLNIGAGTITCNYDGARKHRTEIQDDVFVGSGTQLVAPVCIGKEAYIGAGSTITRDVPAKSLALRKGSQSNEEGWTQKRQVKVKSQQSKVKGGREKQ